MTSPAPRRIASLLASATEILYGIGLGDAVVAVSHECDYPADAVRKPRVTRSLVDDRAASAEIDVEVSGRVEAGLPLYEIDEELICRLAPDLIVTQEQCDVCAVRFEDVVKLVGSRDELRGTRVVALNPARLEDIFSDIRRVGTATGRSPAAEQYARRLAARVEAIRAVTRGIPPEDRPRVACIEWIEPLMLAANWTPELVEIAGGVNLITTAGQHSPYVPWPDVVASEPDVVIVSPCGFDLSRTLAEAPALRRYDGWNDLPAVRHGRVVAVDGNVYFNRSGPRIVDTLEILAHVLHPGRFAAPRPEVFFFISS